MKSIKQHILEKLKVKSKYSSKYDTRALESAMTFVNYSNFKVKDSDTLLYTEYMNNAELLYAAIKETNPSINVMSVPEYYNMITGKKFEDVSISAKMNYFRKNGHVVILNKFDEVELNIFISIEKSSYGVIHLDTITQFEGVYLCIDKFGKSYKILDSDTVMDLAMEPGNLVAPDERQLFKGEDIEFNGQNITTFYYLPSKVIEEA